MCRVILVAGLCIAVFGALLTAGDDLCTGFPVDLSAPGAGFPYTPTLADLDGNGAREILLTGGHTFALAGDGSFLPGWPTSEMVNMGYGTNGNMPGPSAADLENNGTVEILWTERDWYAGSSRMWCFNGKRLNGEDLPGFPQEAIDDSSNALDTSFVLGDTDGDGDLEAWGAHTLGNDFIHYRISAFDHLGNRLFTTDLDTEENILSLFFGDLDGDGAEEMFAVSWLDTAYRLHVFQSDGSAAAGYPVDLLDTTFTQMLGPPVPVDLDTDGDLEIMLGIWSGGSGSLVPAYHHDGSDVAGFPIPIATSSQLFNIGLGDITGDGVPELLATDNHLAGNYRLHAVDIATEEYLPGWPYEMPAWPKGIPAVADVDGDGVQDVCITTDGGKLHAVKSDGTAVAGYPKSMTTASISGVAAGDIDGDGLFELVAATWDGLVYAWNTTGPALPGRADWPMRGVNPRNTGVYGSAGGAASGVLMITGPGPGESNPPEVRTFAPGSGSSPLSSWRAYGVDAYGVNVGAGDLDGNGIGELLTGAGPGAVFGPHVRGFNASGAPVPGVNFLAYGTNKYGVNVACGDLDNDGMDEIITGAGPGAVFGPHVRGWNVDGGTASSMAGVNYFAYGTPKWGVNVACGDLDGDGYDEIVTGAGPGAVYGPHVRGWNVDGGTAAPLAGVSFFAYGTLKFGVNVCCGDLDGDGIDEIVTGAGPGQIFGAHVRAFSWDGAAVSPVPGVSFFAYSDARFGAEIGAVDLDEDGMAEILTMPGPDPSMEAWLRGWNVDGGPVEAIPGIDFDAYVDMGTQHGGTVTGGLF